MKGTGYAIRFTNDNQHWGMVLNGYGEVETWGTRELASAFLKTTLFAPANPVATEVVAWNWA